jgi:hypothetical protein
MTRGVLPFLQTLPSAARRLQSKQSFDHYIEVVFEFMGSATAFIPPFPVRVSPIFSIAQPYYSVRLPLGDSKTGHGGLTPTFEAG